MGVPYCTIDKATQIAKDVAKQGGGSEPEQYLKNATVSTNGHSLTLTKKDNTTVTFTPGAFSPFPAEFVTNTTTQAFGQSVVNHPSFKAGMAWYGELRCGDLPDGLLNVECTVKALTDSIAVIELSSSNQEPYRWEYNTDSFHQSDHADWKLVPCIKSSDCPTGISQIDVKYDFTIERKLDGALKCSSIKSLTAGENITIDGNRKINAVDTKYTAGDGIAISADNKISAVGSGKVWKTLNLDSSDILKMVSGGQIVGNFTTEYDPTNYKNDYFLCNIDQTSEKQGSLVYGADSFSKVYVNCAGLTDILPYIVKSLNQAMFNIGFDHNYYQTVVLYAGCDQPVGKADYILSGSGVLEGKNVIYIQDVSQQQWEQNYGSGEKEKDTSSREEQESTVFGEAYVVSIKGKDASNTTAFAFIIGKSQLAYWDTTSNKVKWAYTEPGKFYKVAFDTTHDTLRWLATPTTKTIEGETFIYATELTTEEISSLLNTGLEFESGKYTAYALEDTSMKLFTKCIGLGDKYMSKLFSFNNVFEVPSSTHLEYVGRPIGYMLDTYTWYSDEWDEEAQEYVTVKHIEKNGEHIWQSNVQGVPISLIIPDNIDEQGVAHRNTYILEFDTSALTTEKTLYRHSFKINPRSDATFVEGDWKVICTFQAVNSQMGDNAIEYILFSDQSYQYPTPDWILPCYGKCGEVGPDGNVSKWYDVFRIKATYTKDPTLAEDPGIRCLRFEYLNDDMTIGQVNIVRENNYWNFEGWDYRSAIGTFKSPQKMKMSADVVKAEEE